MILVFFWSYLSLWLVEVEVSFPFRRNFLSRLLIPGLLNIRLDPIKYGNLKNSVNLIKYEYLRLFHDQIVDTEYSIGTEFFEYSVIPTKFNNLLGNKRDRKIKINRNINQKISNNNNSEQKLNQQ